ncbi:MAG: hypothetical protein COZ06_30460 [Armatimonadetes bacterium CG_4_10_14_3_um_filter_66_18]|nr:flippase-like domain-containing protein [Armatimonadota bacterium]OIO97762.1 MAG: hypothetical protein AUJ96_22560 [Armatimonadetes bacterium CG2_30_66_41]PIU92891.1 MAG: hypothetical protein COS65_15590 [Armatimonadetes bacterium CG06_land_8_20_14_3_00_66_21]PIW21141.1 MAG: hypothetical protein COW34_00090 [Armatimonadetes bacterium CG17_big_fil_post_rev_8_21_14_2_50_66_6]PIX46872.1 MAG: hypothetical protein COZ57_10060 [Armatimonadetes bacterium CG_4_8_14_3_um_filter_66_20]PIY39004.1 MAG:
MKRRVLFVLGIVLSCLFLYLAFRRVSIEELRLALAETHWAWLVASVGAMLLDYCFMAVRWQLLLRPERRLPYPTVFAVLTIGFFANNVLPARAGEVLRAYALGRKEGMSKSFCLGSIVVERGLDLVVLLAFVFLGGLFIPLPGWAHGLSELAGVLLVLVVVVFAVVLAGEARVEGVLARLERAMPSRKSGFLVAKFRGFRSGISSVANWRLLPVLLALSACVWALNATSGLLALRSIGGGTSLLGMIFVIGAVNLGLIVPSSPGFVGTYQWLCIHAMAALGIAEPVALAFSLLFHASWYLPSTVIGFVAALRYNLLGSGRLSATQEAPEEAAEVPSL